MPISITISQQPNGIQFQGSGSLNTNSFFGKTAGSVSFASQGTRFRSKALTNVNLKRFSWIGINAPTNNTFTYYPNLFPVIPNYGNSTTDYITAINVFPTNNQYFMAGQDGFAGQLLIPYNYVSGTEFNWGFLIPNISYSSLGMSPQTIIRSWTGSTGVVETLTINVGFSTVN